jgi:dUTPase
MAACSVDLEPRRTQQVNEFAAASERGEGGYGSTGKK